MTKKNLLLIFIVLATWFTTSAGKLSSSTQLFIAERDGLLSLDEPTQFTLPSRAPLAREVVNRRLVAAPMQVGSKTMVSAFIHIAPTQVAQLLPLGVVVEQEFKHFVTALIPVDQLEAVAALEAVQEVNVAQLMQPDTDMARNLTFTTDVLNYTPAAMAAGQPYGLTGKGVLVAVIDQGIDFQHTMFLDSEGNSRIRRAYLASGQTGFLQYDDPSTLGTDLTSTSHGTHTSTIAAGSNITLNGITYGGMAPEADLLLVGLGSYMYNTTLANAVKLVGAYADSVGQPCVLSISIGSHEGPHDGTGELAEAYAEFAGDHANHIICCSAGNNAGKGTYGSAHNQGEATPDVPFSTVVYGYGSTQYSGFLNYFYSGKTWFYARTPDVPLVCRLHLVNTLTSTLLWTSDTITATTTSVDGFTDYFDRSPTVTFAQDSYSGKYYIEIYYGSMMRKTSSYTDSRYALGVSVYPAGSDTCTIDCWDNGTNTLAPYAATIGEYTFVAANDNSNIGISPCSEAVISVGAYCSKTDVTDYQGEQHSDTATYTVGDICYFSSYQMPGYGPTGAVKPDITAPGALVVAGVNHYDTKGYMSGDKHYLIYNNENSSLGSNSGTSMSTPCVAGIIALWLQAAQLVNKTLNTEGIRDVLQHTAITDEFTAAKPYNFGRYGKIDALAGIRYILGDTFHTPGDVNHDGVIDITDVTLLIDRVLAGAPIDNCCDTCGDADQDGTPISISDVTALIDIALAQ